MKVFKQIILTILILSVPAYAAQILLKSISTTNPNRLLKSTTTNVVDEAAAITANRALASDANGIPTHTAVTTTELGYLSGVTSNIQTQIDSASGVPGGSNTQVQFNDSLSFGGDAGLVYNKSTDVLTSGGVIVSGATASTVPYLNGSKQITSSSVTPTELGYLSGATSNLQSQISALGGGGITGSTGSTDNALLRADGTGGSTAQSSTVTLSDTGAMVNELTSGSSVALTLKAHSGSQSANVFEMYRSNGDLCMTMDNNGSMISCGAFTTNTLRGYNGGIMEFGSPGAGNIMFDVRGTAGNQPWLTMMRIQTSKPSNKSLVVQAGFPSQTANLQEWQDDTETPLSWIGPDGSPGGLLQQIKGSTGSTDNRVLRADGTGGRTLQNSLMSIADDGATTLGTSVTSVEKSMLIFGNPNSVSPGIEWTSDSAANGLEFKPDGVVLTRINNLGWLFSSKFNIITYNTTLDETGIYMNGTYNRAYVLGSSSNSTSVAGWDFFDGTGTDSYSTIRVNPSKATNRGLVVKAFTSQSANLQEWQNSSSSPLSWIASDGSPGGLLSQANKALSNLTTTAINQNLIGDTGSAWTIQTKAGTSSQSFNIKSGNASAGNSGDIFLASGTASGTRGSFEIDARAMSTNANITLSGITNADIAISDSSTDPAWDFFGNLTTPSGVTNTGGIRARGVAVTPLSFFTSNDSTANATKTNDLLIETGNKTAGTGDGGSIKMSTGTSLGGVSGGYRLEVGNSTGHTNSGGFFFRGGDVTGDGSHSPASGDVEFDTGFGTGTNDNSGSFIAYTGDADTQTGAVTLNTGSSTSFASGGLYSTTGQAPTSTGGFQFTSGDASAGTSGGFVIYTGSGTDASGGISITTGNVSAGDSGNFVFTSGVATGGVRGKVLLSSSALQVNESVFMSTKDSSSNKPTIAADGHLGSTGAVSVDNSASDVGGKFTLTPGGTSIALGLQATITLHGTCLNNPTVVLYPANTNAATAEATLGIYADGASANTFTVSSNTALTTGTAYIFSYVVICH